MKNAIIIQSLIILSLICLTVSARTQPNFKFHYIEKDPDWLTSAQQTTLSDIDNDGDLDWTTGNVHQNPGLFWYEYIGPGQWTQHIIGSDDGFYGGAAALDVNDDGRMDIISGQYLFINKKGSTWPEDLGWDKYKIGTSDDYCHDMVTADLNQDGRVDLITNSGHIENGEGLCWYESGEDGTKPWTRHDIGGPDYRIHAGSSPQPVGDLDGDGDPDIAAAGVWFENTNSQATAWKKHQHDLIGQMGPWGMGVKTHVIDLDADGDMDIVQGECDLRDKNAGLGWLENDGQGNFKIHWLSNRTAKDDFHSLYVFDCDLDGDYDILTGNGPLADGRQTFLFENLAGSNRNPGEAQWKKHVILEGFVAHDSVVGDVDGDGDSDIISKEWTEGSLYYLENTIKQSQ
jgi:hypothetical protein